MFLLINIKEQPSEVKFVSSTEWRQAQLPFYVIVKHTILKPVKDKAISQILHLQ